MSREPRALGALSGLLLLGLAACQVNASGPAPATAPAAPAQAAAASAQAPAVAASAAPSAAPSASAPASSASAGLLLGPAPAGAPAAEREAHVTRLLTGQNAAALPERATDPDSEFDGAWEHHILWRLRPETGMSRGPKVRTGELTVSAGLPVDVVKRIFRQNLGRIRQCYEQQLAKQPKLEGKVTLDFTITLQGDVQGLRANAVTLNDAPLLECLARVMSKDVTFPRPEAGAPVAVSVPVLLAP